MGVAGYVGSQAEDAPEGKRRARGMLLSLAFFAGITLSLLGLGIAASFAGRLFARWNWAFAIVGAIFSLLAGIAAIFAPALRRRIPDPEIRKRGGLTGAFIYGCLYSVATVTTSAGPLLLLLTVAAAVGHPWYGAILSLSYAIGRGLPFLLLGMFAGTVGTWLAHVDRARRTAEILSGVALIAVAVYFIRLAETL